MTPFEVELLIFSSHCDSWPKYWRSAKVPISIEPPSF
jgi:hypothetical protein